MKIAFVYGTRPEIIKLGPIIRLCSKKKIKFFTIHTGQHYSHNMFRSFLNDLNLPAPEYNLKIKSKAPYRQGDHTGRMMIRLEEILLKELPQVVLVQGDTNTVLAASLATSKISTTRSFTEFDIKLGHVEAGLRSYDRGMPEEINRVMSDHLSDFLFVPTKNAQRIAMGESICKDKIFITGNTIVDAVQHALAIKNLTNSVLARYDLKKREYMLLTLHRQENVDNSGRINKILTGLKIVGERYKMPIIFPIHPRTVKMFSVFDIKPSRYMKLIEPCGFFEFLQLEANAELILTDSGGVQEEACILGVPCVTLRTSTERPETVDVGANVIAGINPEDIKKAAGKMLARKRNWENPFGKGDSAERIVSVLREQV